MPIFIATEEEGPNLLGKDWIKGLAWKEVPQPVAVMLLIAFPRRVTKYIMPYDWPGVCASNHPLATMPMLLP
ncbi:MAG TPA: hypothetical protein VKT29_02540 [Terriglobales bacterium]|nr:hypothetical protein [Terriglobales bacterium]